MYQLTRTVNNHKIVVEATAKGSSVEVVSWIDGWPYDRYEVPLLPPLETAEQVEAECEICIIYDHVINDRIFRHTWTDRKGGTHFWELDFPNSRQQSKV